MRFDTILRLALVAVVAAAAGGMALAAPPMDEIDTAFLGMQNNLLNMRAMLERGGGAGISRSKETAADGTALPPWLESRCGHTISKVDRWLDYMASLTGQLEVYYGDKRNRDALQHLANVRGNLRQVAEGMAAIKRSPAPANAIYALDGVIRPFNRAREAAAELRGCCPAPEVAVSVKRPEGLGPRKAQ